MKNEIQIKNISIKLVSKEFSYYRDEEEGKKECETQIKEFRQKHQVLYEEECKDYKYRITLYYYCGNVAFNPVKKDGSSIQMEIKISQDAMSSVLVMCLDSVCDICEKQTKAFQNTFVNFVRNNEEALVNQSEKMKKGLIARGIGKVLGNN